MGDTISLAATYNKYKAVDYLDLLGQKQINNLLF